MLEREAAKYEQKLKERKEKMEKFRKTGMIAQRPRVRDSSSHDELDFEERQFKRKLDKIKIKR